MIDTHCHLADKKFAADLPQVLERAEQSGVDRLICIADSQMESERCLVIAEQHEKMYCSVGVHPHHAKEWKEADRVLLRALVERSRKIRAIGEIGLDYHYDFSPRDAQRRAFEDQLRLAKELQLPAIVHNRESIADLRAIIDEVMPEKLVLHCCTEKFSDVSSLLQRGYFLSFTGIATYPNAQDVRETIRKCPLSQLMLETDAPYLAPLPHRGQRNEPAFVVEVAQLVAEVKAVSFEEVDRVTTANALNFFSL